MKRPLYLHEYEWETVALSLERNAGVTHAVNTVAVLTGQKELLRIRDLVLEVARPKVRVDSTVSDDCEPPVNKTL